MSVLKMPIDSDDHLQGNKDTPIILVEYGDYECPACGHAYTIVKQVQQHFGDQLCFVFRNFPLAQVHPHAQSAAETAEFADKQGLFWEMHDLLYENQDRLSMDLLMELTEALGLSAKELKLALEQGTYLGKIKKDFMSGIRSGVNGTPTFFINGDRHNGSFEYNELVYAIENAKLPKVS